MSFLQSTVSIAGRDVIQIADFNAEQVRLILDTAAELKSVLKRSIKKLPSLRGKAIVNLFFEPSTRTRTSFELAGKYLGADVISINAATSSVVKGESVRDTLLTVESMAVDAMIIRHKSEGVPQFAANVVKPVIINAGDGCHAHPSQALLDLLTIHQLKAPVDQLRSLKIAIVGDILHSRVARSDMAIFKLFGANIHLAAPPTLLPRFIDDSITVHSNVDDAIRDADVVIILRLQLERMQAGLIPSADEYSHFFGIDRKRLNLAKSDALVMHPGPQNNGLEIAFDVNYSEQSVIRAQVNNGLAVRMALLLLTLSGEKVVL